MHFLTINTKNRECHRSRDRFADVLFLRTHGCAHSTKDCFKTKLFCQRGTLNLHLGVKNKKPYGISNYKTYKKSSKCIFKKLSQYTQLFAYRLK